MLKIQTDNLSYKYLSIFEKILTKDECNTRLGKRNTKIKAILAE